MMKQQLQAFLHKPEAGQYGDCHRTCLARVLGLHRDTVPNFGVHYNDHEAFSNAEARWLALNGLVSVSVPFDGSHGLQSVLDLMGHTNPGLTYLVAGRSARGFNHSVVACDGQIVWDPVTGLEHSLVGPCDDGLYWLEFFSPLSFKESL